MKAQVWMMVSSIVGMLATRSMGQAPEITLFERNGQLSWTNAVNTNVLYRVEWSSQAGGPWHSFTYQPINTIDAHSNTTFLVSVPMFYRVVMMTNEPLQGMVWIDGGDVELGQTFGQTVIAGPVHTNFISGFWIDEMEVTKAKWDEVYNWAITNGYIFDNAGSGKMGNHPVQTVNWYDCVKWCNARSQKERLTPCYSTNGVTYLIGDNSNVVCNWSANGYRLPTEAEWEKAARGGRQRRLFPWGGDTIQHARANYFADTNSYWFDTSPTPSNHPTYNDGFTPYTSPVGSFDANGYGLHDMAGNVCEWCWDWYGAYSESYQTDPRGPTSGLSRIRRGGAWDRTADYSLCAGRSNFGPGSRNQYIGFRCARGP